MNTKRFIRLSLSAILILTCAGPFAARSQTPAETEIAALRRKAAEADQLREDLAAARKEIEALRSELDRLRGGSGATPTSSAPPPLVVAAPPKTSPPAAEPAPGVRRLQEDNQKLREQLAQARQTPPPAEPPPLQPGEVLSVDELTARFAANELAADARYRGHLLRVRGEVDHFAPPLFGTTFKVFLKGPTRLRQVECEVKLPGSHNPELRNGPTGQLYVKPPFKDPVLFLKAGQTVVIEGACAGVRDNRVLLEKCKRVEP